MKPILKKFLAAACFMALSCTIAMAGIAPAKPQPPRLVNDFAKILSPYQERELEEMLVAFDDTTSNQIVVVTMPDLHGYEAAEMATAIGSEWGVGGSKFDNGIIILIKPKIGNSYGDVFIAVGYGLEGAIPDVYATRITREYMVPYFKNNDYYGGALAGCQMIMKLASGEISEMRDSDSGSKGWSIGEIVFLIVFFGLLGLALFGKGGKGNGGNSNSGNHRTRRPDIYVSPRGGFGGFGGFGGGSSSGGFGGFGGGNFGGGGGGSKW